MMADGKKIYLRETRRARIVYAGRRLGTDAEESEALFPADAEPIVPWFDVSPDGRSGVHR
jgi:hypothetical protein